MQPNPLMQPCNLNIYNLNIYHLNKYIDWPYPNQLTGMQAFNPDREFI